MLPKRPRRQDTDTLIWEYLDGDISPSRARTLSGMLRRRSAARQRLAESAMLHGMLFEHFKRQSDQAPADEHQRSETESGRSRRRRGKRPAA